MSRSKKKQEEKAIDPIVEVNGPGGMMVPQGGFDLGLMPTGHGMLAQAGEADVGDELLGLAPAFGDVLESVGMAVAESQAALDKGLVETAKKLSETKVKVVTEVIQNLDDDGLPNIEDTEIVTNEVALINYITPTVHEWKNVSLAMDFSVGELSAERGVTFEQKQSSFGVSGGGRWGFGGWFNVGGGYSKTSTEVESEYEADWARGQVRVDAMLAPREVEGFPVPAEVTIGPQIYLAFGSINETVADDVVTERSVDVLVKVLKDSGAANPDAPIEIDSPYPVSFETTGGFTDNTTNSKGEVKFTVKRELTNSFFSRSRQVTLTARLGNIKKDFKVTL